MTAATTTRITVRDQPGRVNVTLDLDLAATTPQQVIDHLLTEQHILRQTPDGQALTWKMARAGAQLDLDKPLEAQGVQQNDTLELLSVNVKG